ncbi:Uga3 protein [Martiniozyma asiatica (nom. inval.)]|nr:Uga3 protein [Martiniozyma asiatica]
MSELRTKLKEKNTRSKLGCISCKKRKKKCDEIKPICTACLKRNIICEYREPFINGKAGENLPSAIDTGLSVGAFKALGVNKELSADKLQNLKFSTISGVKDIVGETVMNIIQNNLTDLNSLFGQEMSPKFDEYISLDNEFFNLIFHDDPEFLQQLLSQKAADSVPKSLEIKLPIDLTLEELSYFEYYCKNILPNMSILPQEFNYYSKIYIPIAFKEPAVLYTLVGWGCRMRKNYNLNFQVENREADKYILMVNEFIAHNNIVLDKEKFITNFVCYMLLVCMEISFGDTSKWSHYFTCCFNMINKMPGDFRYLLSACSIEGTLLAENFAYFDVLASQSNENGTFYPMEDYKDLFSLNNTNKSIHDPIQGCVRPIILLIGDIVSVLVEHNALAVSLDLPECDRFEVMSKMMHESETLDKKIKFSKPDLTCLQYLKSSEELEYHLTLFEVYQLATQIYLRQVIRKLPPVVPEIQILAYNLKEDLKFLVKYPPLKNSLAFPMLLLGISATSSQDRKEIKAMFNALIQSCGYLSSYQKLLIVVDKIWDINELGTVYVDWFKVTKQLGWRLNLGR